MSDLREWAVMLCVVSVGCVIVSFLIPDGNMKKSVNFAFSLFLMTIIIIPICGKSDVEFEFPDISFDELPAYEDYQEDFQEFIQSYGETEIEKQITEILGSICVGSFESEVESYVDDSGNIVITNIHIFLSENDSEVAETVKNGVENLTGIIPQVVIDD